MNAGVKKLNDGDLSRVCGFTRDLRDILSALTSLKCCVGSWQQEPGLYSDRNTCGFSPSGFCAIMAV